MIHPLEARTKLIRAKRKFGDGEVSITELHAAADEYREAMRQHAKAKGLKIRIPSRGYLIRAI